MNFIQNALFYQIIAFGKNGRGLSCLLAVCANRRTREKLNLKVECGETLESFSTFWRIDIVSF